MKDIYARLDEIGEYIQNAKVLPLIKQKILDEDYLMRALEEIFASIPAEIKEAKEIINSKDNVLADSKKEADGILTKAKQECEKLLDQARTEAARLVDHNEIKAFAEEEARKLQNQTLDEVESVRRETIREIETLRSQAIEQARLIEERASERALAMKRDADKYVEDVFNHIEANIEEIRAINKNGRKFLADYREQDLLEKPAKV